MSFIEEVERYENPVYIAWHGEKLFANIDNELVRQFDFLIEKYGDAFKWRIHSLASAIKLAAIKHLKIEANLLRDSCSTYLLDQHTIALDQLEVLMSVIDCQLSREGASACLRGSSWLLVLEFDDYIESDMVFDHSIYP